MYKGYKVAHSNNLDIYIEILQSQHPSEVWSAFNIHNKLD